MHCVCVAALLRRDGDGPSPVSWWSSWFPVAKRHKHTRRTTVLSPLPFYSECSVCLLPRAFSIEAPVSVARLRCLSVLGWRAARTTPAMHTLCPSLHSDATHISKPNPYVFLSLLNHTLHTASFSALGHVCSPLRFPFPAPRPPSFSHHTRGAITFLLSSEPSPDSESTLHHSAFRNEKLC